MKRVLLLLLVITIVSSAQAADVLVAKTKLDAEKLVRAYKILTYAAAHDMTPENTPEEMRQPIILAAEFSARVMDLGADPTNQEINEALVQIGPEGALIALRWTDSSPVITCADIDNATLVAKNLCSRLDSTADRAGMKAGVSLRMRCVSRLVGRVQCQ